MPSLIAEGRVSIVDLTDRGQLTGYINSNQPRVQVYDSIQNTYSPDYTVSPYLVLTPVVYLDDSQVLLSDTHLSITWKRKVGNTEYDLGTGETVSNKILTVSANVLNNVTPYIAYVAHISYTDSVQGYTLTTEANNDISLVTSGDIGNSVVFTIYAPNGTVFTNGQGTKRIQTSAYYGSTVISNATYKWYDYTSGSWTLIAGATGAYLDVNGTDIVGQDSFKCVMTYQGMDYTDVITLIDKTDNYQCDIDSTAGNVFKNSTGQTYLVANLFQSGHIVDGVKCLYEYFGVAPANPEEGDFYHKKEADSNTMPLMRYSGVAWQDVTDNATYKYEKIYTWYRRDASGNAMDNGDPFATGKVIYVDDDSIINKCTFVCEVQNVADGPLIATGNYTIVDVTDPIVSGNAPSNPVQGLVWFDTTSNVMKIYDNGAWKVVGASDANKNKVFTSVPVPPYKVGDLWLKTESNGDKVIYYCSTARDSGSYVAADWSSATDYQTPAEVLQELQNFAQEIIQPLYGLPDKQITAWFQDADPSTSWTSEQKTQHVGDIWYSSNYGGTEGNIKLHRYSWSLSTGYTWEPITDLSMIETYNLANEAKDTADHKRRVFYGSSNPTVPYDVGDLWSQGETGNLLICKTAKTSSQSFSLNDWEESARYTVDREMLQKQIDGRIMIWFQDLDPVDYAGIMSFTVSNSNLNVSISGSGFATSSRQSGRYVFTYNGSNWRYNNANANLSNYGITIVTGTPVTNDTITVVYQKPDDRPSWATAVKAKHVGDLWYSPTTKITKRYTEYVYNNSSTFGWEVTDSLEAVRAAQNAQAIADGTLVTHYTRNVISCTASSELSANIVELAWNKMVDETGTYAFSYNGSVWSLTVTYPNSSTDGPYTVDLSDYGVKITGTPTNGSTVTVNFTYNYPIPPYDVGDLWVNELADIMVCNTAKTASQSFSINDWDYGNALEVFVNTTYREDLINIEGLIDAKIDAWFQEDNPSVTWTTTDMKKAHIGDIWYKDYDHIYRYSDDFRWITVTDATTIAAYRAAATAQDTKDGRRRIFIGSANPVPPYDRGDIWMRDTSGSSLMYCNVSRRDGETFVSNDFVIPSQYTDYKIYVGTTAPSDHSLLWMDISTSGSPVLKQYISDASSPGWVTIGTPTKIYTSDPVPPYYAGDIFIKYNDNSTVESYICVTSRNSGSFNQDDWVQQYKADQIYVGPTAPSDIEKLWVDTNQSPCVLKYYSNGAWEEIGRLQDISGIQQDITEIRGMLTELTSKMADYDGFIQICNATTNRSALTISINRDSWFNSTYEYGTYEFKYNGSAWKLNGTTVTLSNYFITITGGTATNGDIITVRYYSTKSVLGFSVTNYEEKYSTINGKVDELIASKEIQDQYFDFTDGFTVGTSANRSAVNIKNSGVTLRDTSGNDALNIRESGVETKNVNVSNSLNMGLNSTMVLGKYRLDFTNNGMSLVWNG